ncbi:MAG: virulence-associated protein E [Caulobacteraceae bacterium]|nr:MAG: virulence-associated protein E [Caulobacteraceae bacterium]
MTTLARIVAACGGSLYDAGRRALIPGPGHAPEDRSVSLFCADDGRILIHCFGPRDDWRTVRDMLALAGLLDGRGFEPAPTRARAARPFVAQPSAEERSARARRIWGAGVAVAGSLAERYLAARGVRASASADSALRFHAAMTSLDDRRRRPALLSAITDPAGVVQGVEATLLARDGASARKADIATPRRVIGRLLGGAVRLQAPSETLLIAEGVESALSAAHALGAPAWAALSAANLARFAPPAGVRRLIIAADADAAGLHAATILAERRRHEVDAVKITTPPEGFNDWNDWVREA